MDKNCSKLYPGFIFQKEMEYDQFKEKTLLPLNKHAQKSGVEHLINQSSSTYTNKHGNKIARICIHCSQKTSSTKETVGSKLFYDNRVSAKINNVLYKNRNYRVKKTVITKVGWC